jgi:hypothetical protein
MRGAKADCGGKGSLAVVVALRWAFASDRGLTSESPRRALKS